MEIIRLQNFEGDKVMVRNAEGKTLILKISPPSAQNDTEE